MSEWWYVILKTWFSSSRLFLVRHCLKSLPDIMTLPCILEFISNINLVKNVLLRSDIKQNAIPSDWSHKHRVCLSHAQLFTKFGRNLFPPATNLSLTLHRHAPECKQSIVIQL